MKNPHVLSAIALAAASLLALSGCSGPTPQVEPDSADSGYTDSADAGTAPAEAAPVEREAAPPPPASAPRPKAPASQPRPAPATGTVAEVTPPPAAPVEEPPRVVQTTVPAGTLLEVEFLDALSSATSQVGDSFRTRVIYDVASGGDVVIPAGSLVAGTVTEAVSLKKIGGRARLALDFTTLELPSGTSAAIAANFAEEGKSETKKDAATIGGATVGGAILGRELKKGDKKKGALIGAIVGAAAGTAVAAKTEGQEVEIPEGTVVAIELSTPTVISRRN